MIVCKLKDLLASKKMTRYELRKRSRVTYPTLLALYGNKSKGYSSDVLDKLCYALKCQPGDLLSWKPNRFTRTKKTR